MFALAEKAVCSPLRPFAPHPSLVSPLKLLSGLVRQEGAITAVFHLSGDLALLDLPRNRVPEGSARRHQLWHRSCFEFFLANADDDGYLEVNLCPDGCWNVYRFAGYRRGMAELPGAVVWSAVAAANKTLTFAATISLAAYIDDRLPLRAALSAVLLHRDGTPSYWALEHAASGPDFHDPRGFLYELAEVAIKKTLHV